MSSALWKAFAVGSVTEEEAPELSVLIEARKAVPPPSTRPVRRRVGSRPTPALMTRRRSWAASGRLPPRLASMFTLAEQAVLSVVAVEVQRSGACTLTLEHIAASAGVCRSTVKNALREAQHLGLIRVEERRLTAWRNAPNRVPIVSAEWRTWMRLRSKGAGGQAIPSNNRATATERVAGGQGCRVILDGFKALDGASPHPDQAQARAPFFRPRRSARAGTPARRGTFPSGSIGTALGRRA